MERETKGYIFVNENGCFGREYLSSGGFGQPSVRMQWVSDIDDAEVFSNKLLTRKRHKDQLKDCQALKAVQIKSVRLKMWSDEND